MSTRNGIIRPDAVNIETTFAPGPLAQPAVVTMQGPGQMKILAIGGLSKVEALAGQIVGHLLTPGVLNVPLNGDFHGRDNAFVGLLSERAVDIAEAILAESERRTKERQQPTESE